MLPCDLPLTQSIPILTSKRLLQVHKYILKRRHLIIPLQLRRKWNIHCGIQVIVRIIEGIYVSPFLPPRLTLHLAREFRRHHMLRAARIRVHPRHGVWRVKVHVIIHRSCRRGRSLWWRQQNNLLLLILLNLRRIRFLDAKMLFLLLNCTFLVVYATEYPIIQLQTIKIVIIVKMIIQVGAKRSIFQR